MEKLFVKLVAMQKLKYILDDIFFNTIQYTTYYTLG
jgi:hypothetical protein